MNTELEKEVLMKTLARFFGVDRYSGYIKEGTNYLNAKYRTDEDIAKEKNFVQRIMEYFKPGIDPDNSFKFIVDSMANLDMIICGGAINSIFTNAKINDLDFYVTNSDKIPAAKEFLKFWFPDEEFKSSNATTYKRKVGTRVYTAQLITRFTGMPSDIFDNFDFTITQGAYLFWEERFEFGERFFPDLAKKQLVYGGNSKFPICAMYRTKKYQERGYNVPGSTIMHIALSIVRLEIKTYADLKEQLMGIDTMYLSNLLNEQKYDDALPVDFGEFVKDAFERIDGIPYANDDVILEPKENQ